MIGLCGAHRTGKTTLAKAFAEKHGEYSLLQTSASQVFKDMGLDPAVDYPLSVRMDVQERILASFEVQYRSFAGRKFITDRTPIDMLAYTLADVRQEPMSPELTERIARYRRDCIRLTNEFFSVLVVVQPGLPVKDGEGKASLSPAYIEHIASLVLGITVSEDVQAAHFYVPRRTLELSRRIACVERAVDRTVERHERQVENAKELGRPIVFH